MSPRIKANLRTLAVALPVTTVKDWRGGKPLTGPDIRTTLDAGLVAKLKAGGYAEVLQAPQRGRRPAGGKPSYILRVHPNGDGPATATHLSRAPKRTATRQSARKIPWTILVALTEAGIAESKKQRQTIGKQLDHEIDELETKLRSTKDRTEKKRLADLLQTTLHTEDDLEGEILRRVHRALSQSEEPFSRYVDLVDWSPQKAP